MVGYICKYSPIEIIEAFGESVTRIEPNRKSQEWTEKLTHPNMCSFMKGVLEEIMEENICEVVLVNCCDSIRRLYDIIKKSVNFVFLVDLPRKTDEHAYRLFSNEIYRLIREYEAYKGKQFSLDDFKNILKDKQKKRSWTIDVDCIGVLGARFKEEILNDIEAKSRLNVINFTCTGNTRFKGDILEGQDVILDYARSLLNSQACMRMAERNLDFLKDVDIKGIIYNTVKFCDFYSFEYSSLKKKLNIPILKLETDYTDSGSGQLATRIDAFLETLGAKKSDTIFKKGKYFAGIDSGSTSTNVVILNENKDIVSYAICLTGAKSLDSIYKAFSEALKKADLQEGDIHRVVSTGYGRRGVPFSDDFVTEITCHGKGAFYLQKEIRTIIDIGGQDSKVIRLNDSGSVVDFVMNDKCSAGTGRFLEVMAKTLEVSIDELASFGPDYEEDIRITNMCTVFAESEVISLIAQNKDKRDIIHALNKSISTKTMSLLDRLGRCGKYMMTGGVAKNYGVVHEIERRLGEKVIIPFEPQIIGALGAALIAAGE
ncbi:MAG: 3-hydroxyacyl-ACP dehydratase [Thermoanaerobacterales bacterium]|nr:3-hydroxyacyl-ACP dehydratase [Thermoanaerobacterales bacterium]